MKLLIYGSKDFGRLARELVRSTGHEFVGFIDDFETGPDIVGTYDVARERFPSSTGVGIVVAIGYEHMTARWSIFEKVKADRYAVPAIVHDRAIMHPGVKVSEGAIVMAGANIDAFTEIGPLSVIWPGAIVSHDSQVGPNCFLSPGAILCGFVTIGAGSFIGAGAVIADHRSVPAGSFIKAAGLFT